MLSSIFSILIILIVLLVPAAIIALIVFAVIKKAKDDKIGDNFEKTVKTLYTYIVLIFFLFMFVGSVIYTFNSAINYLLPEKYSEQYEPAYTAELRDIQKERYEQSQRNRSIIDLTTALSMVAISLPMFLCYSRQAKELGKE